ncbi:MAG: 2-octaprenyl-6-methoxyphenyl hydroxylase [Xanthomonadales bacterium]|nr:2-octaprenyl-6-methoxyphenyl hydroxylase [Xanthomonadales bacterium]
MAEKQNNFDIVIVGGGLAGASLALALADSPYKVAMIEAVDAVATSQPSYDDRTLAVAWTSCRILETLGIWDDLSSSATAIEEIFVSELNRPGKVQLHAPDMGFKNFGSVIEARAIGAALLNRLETVSNLSRFCPARLISMHTGEDEVTLHCQLESEEIKLTTRLVVAADGARSSIREMLGISTKIHDYQQTAVIANVTPEKPHKNRAFERFTQTGPLAILPHVGDRCGMVWTVPSGEEQTLLALSDEEILSRLNQRVSPQTRELLGSFVKIGRRSSYPLYLVQPQTNLAPRVVLIGNAAHAIHPNSAQGFNLALRDGAALAEVLIEQYSGDAGCAKQLQTYDQWRQPDQRETIRYSDGLARLFANPGWLAGLVRGGGIALHELFPPLKRKLALGAMGFRGRLPKLARGETPVNAKVSDNRGQKA